MKKSLIIILTLISSEIFAQEKIVDKIEMCNLLTELKTNDQLHRKSEILNSWNENKYSKKEIDSIWALQIKIDNENTEKLIELTKKYGWLSDERLDCLKLNIWIIFRHSQKKYFEQISELIEKEHNSNRLNDWHYKLIKNHLNGRPKTFD
jgi:hypothetical protein